MDSFFCLFFTKIPLLFFEKSCLDLVIFYEICIFKKFILTFISAVVIIV